MTAVRRSTPSRSPHRKSHRSACNANVLHWPHNNIGLLGRLTASVCACVYVCVCVCVCVCVSPSTRSLLLQREEKPHVASGDKEKWIYSFSPPLLPLFPSLLHSSLSFYLYRFLFPCLF